ncbi:hypothetical protein B0H17DRAFT_550592 [Mycena rosella]|uniref:Uncharacterized protein n=1 Tax=Mycena rosella TaxID=1033263 RepID=A0AAD7DJT3_MYCRO|nr:hypothetical protein B0H17DRAFT_550592 [Mycena rosella]
MHSLIIIYLVFFFATTSAVSRPGSSQWLARALERTDNVCYHYHGDDTTGSGVSWTEVPLKVPMMPPAVDHDLAGASIDLDTLCLPVPAGYIPVSLEELEEAARIGEMLADEYAEEYAQEFPGILSF